MNLLNSNQPHADLQNVLTLVWCLWKFRATSVSTQSLPGSSLLRVVGYLLLSGGLFVQCFCPGTRQTTALPSVTEKTVGKQTMHGKVQKKNTRETPKIGKHVRKHTAKALSKLAKTHTAKRRTWQSLGAYGGGSLS
jgi:hypothetical protein